MVQIKYVNVVLIKLRNIKIFMLYKILTSMKYEMNIIVIQVTRIFITFHNICVSVIFGIDFY